MILITFESGKRLHFLLWENRSKGRIVSCNNKKKGEKLVIW